jgi:hypothetical protein
MIRQTQTSIRRSVMQMEQGGVFAKYPDVT